MPTYQRWGKGEGRKRRSSQQRICRKRLSQVSDILYHVDIKKAAIGIRCTTNLMAFKSQLQQIESIINEEILNALSYLGEQCVARIRDRSANESWIDHTGNLRSSIGYGVYAKGKSYVQSAFDSVLSGHTGSLNGKRYLDSLSSKYADTYALVVVAGMSYADYVEAIEGKDVLASTELWARSELQKHLDMAKERAIKRIIAM